MTGESIPDRVPDVDALVTQFHEAGLPKVDIDPLWMPEPGRCEFCFEDKDEVSYRETSGGSAIPICLDCCKSNFGSGFEGLWVNNMLVSSLDIAMVRAYQQFKQTGTLEEYGEFQKMWGQRV